MLYYLFDWLHKLNFPGAGMFGYTSFRALMAIILALLISSIWGDKFIKLLKRKQITETQRAEHGWRHHHCSHSDPLPAVRKTT